MRSPSSAFDLRAELSQQICDAIEAIDVAAPGAKAIHRCRIHLKHARALARIGRACAPGLSAVFNDSARANMRALGQARDLAALAAAARSIARKERKRRAAALENVAVAFDGARAALPALDLNSVRAGLRDLLAIAQVWPETSSRQIAKGADRLARRARRSCRRGAGSAAPTRRHKWRKREKDRLYAVESLGKAWPARRKRRRGKSRDLSKLLGHERDALLLVQRLQAAPSLAGDAVAARRAIRGLKRRCRKWASHADALGKKVHAGGA